MGCLIFTLLVSVLGIDLRAFRRRVREGVCEGSTSVESASRDTKRGVGLRKYDSLASKVDGRDKYGWKKEDNEGDVERGLRTMGY